jgi:hypothetical protein
LIKSARINRIFGQSPQESTAKSGRWSALRKQAQTLMIENPKASLIAAFAAGVVVGWVIKRR